MPTDGRLRTMPPNSPRGPMAPPPPAAATVALIVELWFGWDHEFIELARLTGNEPGGEAPSPPSSELVDRPSSPR